MNKGTEAPKRVVRNWSASVMRTCDFCGHHADTVLNDDSSAICPSCCDAEHSGNLQCALEEALERNVDLIAALEQAQQEHRVHAARLLGERGQLKERIAELEASKLSVKLQPRKTAADYVDGEFTNEDLAMIYNSCRLECEVKIKNAGGTVEGSE